MQWTSYQIRKITGCACARNAENVFPATNFKGNRKIAIPACITARAWSTCRDACRDRLPMVVGKTFPAFPAYAQPAILRIWQEAHGLPCQGHTLFLPSSSAGMLSRVFFRPITPSTIWAMASWQSAAEKRQSLNSLIPGGFEWNFRY